MVKVLGYSMCLADKVGGPPLRGFISSSFASAANLRFSDDFMLSLNAMPPALPQERPSLLLSSSPFTCSPAQQAQAALQESSSLFSAEGNQCEDMFLPLLPNGILLASGVGESFFARLRPGMSALLGGERLYLEALSCSLDLSFSPQWDPRIARAPERGRENLRRNNERLTSFWRQEGLQRTFIPREGEGVVELAGRICGRGMGLTPGGDDFLLGWMAVGWLLYASEQHFLTTCQQILRLARRRTHLLSQCWLAYAADGKVAWSVKILLARLLEDNPERLERALRHLLTLGASSGFDLLQGISYALAQYDSLAGPTELF